MNAAQFTESMMYVIWGGSAIFINFAFFYLTTSPKYLSAQKISPLIALLTELRLLLVEFVKSWSGKRSFFVWGSIFGLIAILLPYLGMSPQNLIFSQRIALVLSAIFLAIGIINEFFSRRKARQC